MANGFLIERIGDLFLRIELVNQFDELLFDGGGEVFGFLVRIDERSAAVADGFLEGGEFGGGVRVFRLKILASLRGVGRVAEIEEGVAVHLRVAQHAVEDFQFGDGSAVADVFLDPRFFIEHLLRHGIGNPAIAFAEDTDEVGSAGVDFL